MFFILLILSFPRGLIQKEPCHIIRFTLAFEAFVGVIFAGFCSAILFAKMQRIEFGASVKFSSCLCLQFGEGVTDAKVNVVDSVGVSVLCLVVNACLSNAYILT